MGTVWFFKGKMYPSAPPNHNIYPTIPPENSPKMIPPPYPVHPYSAQVPQTTYQQSQNIPYPQQQQNLPYPQQQQNFPYPQQQPGYNPTMQSPVAAPRQHSVDLGNTQIPQQTAINTEVNLETNMMERLEISQNKDSEKAKKAKKTKAIKVR